MGLRNTIFGSYKLPFQLNMRMKSDFLDSSPLKQQITVVGTPVLTGDGVSFGAGNYLTIEGNTTDDGIQSYSYGCQFKVGDGTGLQGILGRSRAFGTPDRYGIYIENGIFYSVYGAYSSSISIAPYLGANWNKLVVIVSRVSGNVVKVYINENLVINATYASGTNLSRITTKFFIGAYGASNGTTALANSHFKGQIKNVFFVKRLITIEESRFILTE